MGFYATCAVVGALLVVILVISGNDLEYVIYGLMACSNAVCLVIVAVLFGYGLAEYPRSLWQDCQTALKLRRVQISVTVHYETFKKAAEELAGKLGQVYQLRKAASSSLRAMGPKIMLTAAECPLDIASVLVMDPVRGPSIPETDDEYRLAFISQLQEIELDQTHNQKLTEVDRWLLALEAKGLLPRLQSQSLFEVQEAMFEAGLKGLGDVDHLDPGVRGDVRDDGSPKFDAQERGSAIVRQLEYFLGNTEATEAPGDGVRALEATEMAQAMSKAVMARNDYTVALQRELASGRGMDPMEMEELEQESGSGSVIGGFRAAAWDDKKLIRLRTEMFQLNRKYRKAKKKFDLAVVEAILLEDLDKCHLALLPWGNVGRTLREAWSCTDP
eukprot:CAMPEP_0172161190 /NCGR_PEP_ID=MMETSP1050-20130122/5985_1 /TAXON_ID=233186 /ORGANISM="Cryptomonas curvata, Strain CCAP979/52" /LENGTH=386 /DNA_ID=CAMNT_0012831055 /DNA_START=475 /DNA_END=1632 /DNA_ORIENTATION=+